MNVKNLLLLLITCFSTTSVFSTHLIGGEITYEYLDRPSGSEVRYKVQVHLLRDCVNSSVPFDDQIKIGAYNISDNKLSKLIKSMNKA